jgi:MFS transporter, DHA1 family, tetracycline resistance protein
MQGGGVRVLVPRLGEARLATLGVFAYVAGLVTVAEAPSLAITGLGLALCGVGLGSFNPSASSLASKQADVHDRGTVMGTYQSSGSLARVIGPFVSGSIYAALGPGAPFLVGACVTLPAVWFVWLARRRAFMPLEQG